MSSNPQFPAEGQWARVQNPDRQDDGAVGFIRRVENNIAFLEFRHSGTIYHPVTVQDLVPVDFSKSFGIWTEGTCIIWSVLNRVEAKAWAVSSGLIDPDHMLEMDDRYAHPPIVHDPPLDDEHGFCIVCPNSSPKEVMEALLYFALDNDNLASFELDTINNIAAQVIYQM